MIPFITEFVATFFIMVGLDWVWAHYNIAVEKRKPFLSSVYAGAIAMFSGLLTIVYINNNWMILAAIAGSVVGTFAAVYWKKD